MLNIDVNSFRNMRDDLMKYTATELVECAKENGIRVSFMGKKYDKQKVATALILGNENMDFLNENNIEYIGGISIEDLKHIVNNLNGSNQMESLGFGSYSNVYGYKDYAIKHIISSEIDKCNDVEALKDLQHIPTIIKIYAVINRSTIVCERVYGRTVEEHNKAIKRSIIDVWEDTLADIIRSGYNPKDLHEENVMIDNDGNIKIVDLGWFDKHYQRVVTPDFIKNNRFYQLAQGWVGNTLRGYLSL